MSKPFRPLDQLEGEQLAASDPRDDVWLSASAGTGKTHVLTARVLRLLLRPGFDPSTILCLTFTKAGAAEMADRIHARLAGWVRLKGPELAAELRALGEEYGPEAQARARTLFAKVLDARGGGLRIQTIHSFCQSLLASFPLEAGLVPGFRPLDAREESVLARRVLADMVVGAEAGGDTRILDALRGLSLRLGEGGAETFLVNCARAPDALEQLPLEIGPFVREQLDVPTGDIDALIAEGCGDGGFDTASLQRIATANAAWGTKTGLSHADLAEAFLASDPAGRAAQLGSVASIAFTAKGELRPHSAKLLAADPDYAEHAARIGTRCRELLALRAGAQLADLFAGALHAGRAYARDYAEAKRTAGAVDFDDLIRATVALLGQPGMGDWIRYKLDQATDHVLVDEAQDTNARQWRIVSAIADEFFAGEGAKGRKMRTIFSVGDFKQAIFGFQGTDPQFFAAARIRFAALAQGIDRELLDLSLSRSYRSTPPVLELVDTLVGQLGHETLGLIDPPEPHRSAKGGPGSVVVWNPVSAGIVEGDEPGDEGWVDDATRAFAGRLASQVREWLDAPLWLESKGRPLAPEDILILVRRRGDLASLIVARLYAEKVPVAGVDRLRLNAPLAVRDLLAAARFALQPGDDLNLAALLVSPLIGWSQDDLLRHALRGEIGLWQHLRTIKAPFVSSPSTSPVGVAQDELRAPREVETLGSGPTSLDFARDERVLVEALEKLTLILNLADFTTPYRFFETILSGPIDGRRSLLRRLGAEARDPIEELLSAALDFERTATPSLQRFLDWFDRGDVEIVRDPSAPLDAVRVMTVHGAKGLQAPLVILADATADPRNSRRSRLDWRVEGFGEPLPLFRPRKDELVGGLLADLEAADRRDLEEHWRLLYVALTRAEERLVIGGALGPKCKGVPPPDSWYAAVTGAMESLGAEPVADPRWAEVRAFRGKNPAAAVTRSAPEQKAQPADVALPAWLTRAAPQEARPPRPLAPSSLGPDDAADPPSGPVPRAAAERGRLLHALFERLPDLSPDDRPGAADRWLAGSAGVADPATRSALIEEACAIISDPRFAELFDPQALAEAPIAAVVDGVVVAGTVDRLRVTDDHVLVVDFKTDRRPPGSVDAVPRAHLRQMAAYVAALAVIFPDRPIRAALLYTAGPSLIEVPPELLERDKPGLDAAQLSFASDS